MATYFHHHHHNHNHHGGNSDDGALQTLILMNPNFVGYNSDPHAPPPPSSGPSSFLFQAPTLYNAPPPLLPQLVGVPLHSSGSPGGGYAPPGEAHAQQHYAAAAWAQLGAMAGERESPRAQQGLSLTLSSHSHSFAGGQDHHQLQPSPGAPDQPAFDGRSESPTASAGDVHGAAALITSSKYLKAAQVLLEEVVNVSVDRARPESSTAKRTKNKGESPPAAVAGDPSKEEHAAAELSASDKHELHMKKAKLITLLDEVDQRHRQYHHQMQAVVASFEQVAGAGSARAYTSLALKTISSQFRSLRGAISGQIKAANKGLGEGGGGEGEGGSRLKFLDHQMRQQRALQQLGMIQNNAWRPQRGLPEKAVSVLRAWLFEHFLHPYPKDSDKIMLAKQTGLTRSQVSNWFINARVRLWKPMIEEMYAEEVKEREQNGSDGKPSRQDEHEENGSKSVTDEKDHNNGEAAENHGPNSIVISGSSASIPPYKANPENVFALVGSSKMDGETQGSLKKQRNNEYLSNFTDGELYNNGSKEEVPSKYVREKQEDCSMMPGSGSGYMGGLVSYPIGEIGRFGDGQFPTSFSAGNGVSLTLGLESLSMPGSNQAFLPNNQDIDQYRGRLEMVELNGFGGVKAPNASHSSNAYASHQLLHDFVA